MKIIFYLALSGLSGLTGLVITRTVASSLEQLRSQQELDILDKWAAQSIDALVEPVKQSGKFQLGKTLISEAVNLGEKCYLQREGGKKSSFFLSFGLSFICPD